MAPEITSAGAGEEQRPLLTPANGSVPSYGTAPGAAPGPRGSGADGAGPAGARNYFESLDYEQVESYADNAMVRPRLEKMQHVASRWMFALLIGICTGGTAFLINMAVENIAGHKFSIVSTLLIARSHVAGFALLAVANVALVGFAAALCQFISIEAAGSGIPEVKAYLNGVDTPRIFAPKTLLVKVLGSIGSVAGGLPVGKEGPLVHTGACFANIMGQGGSRRYHLTAKFLRFFKNDSDRRDLVTCGAAAGVAAAFRAPVGGVLMALEEVTSWWRSSLLWRVFFTNAIVAVTLQTLMSACEGGRCGPYSSGGFIIFDNSEARNDFGLLELLPVAGLGITGGILGSLFNHLNLSLNKWRQTQLPKTRAVRIAEACLMALLTSALRFLVPFLAPCLPCPDAVVVPKAGRCGAGEGGSYVAFNCPAGHYNDLASALFTTNDDAARNLFSTGTKGLFTYRSLLIFFLTFYPDAILTYGVTVPSGLFVPSIISGATYGRAMGILMTSWLGEHRVDQGTYALLGAASFLGGSMRMTVSISVILLELTGSLRMLPLIMLTLLISKTVGDAFNHAIYDAHIHLKGIPFLEARPELFMGQLRARDAVTHAPITLPAIEQVGRILRVLQDTPHNAYPVLEGPETGAAPQFQGMILRRHILVLLRLRANLLPTPDPCARLDLSVPFEEFGKPGSGKGLNVEDIQLSEAEQAMYLDLRPYVNRSHYLVEENMSLTKVYLLFRQLGLRHLCVVPSPSQVLGVITRKDLLPETFSERRVLDKIRDSL